LQGLAGGRFACDQYLLDFVKGLRLIGREPVTQRVDHAKDWNKMPEDSIRRALLRSISAVALLAAILPAAPVRAQGTTATVDDKQVQAFFNGIEQDQRLAGQAPLLVAQAVQAVPSTPADEAALPALEARRTAGLEGYAESRARIVDDPPGPLATLLLGLASLALFAVAATVVTLVLREARKDARQRSLAHRRRLMPREHSPTPSTPATAS
jgi:hypothetical protein